jgi:hypothetical protein
VARAYADRLDSKPIDEWDARAVLAKIDERKKLVAADVTEFKEREEGGI